MKLRSTSFVTALAIVLIGVSPILLTYWLALRHATQTTEERLNQYGSEVLLRSEWVTGKVYAALDRLNEGPSTDPCSPERIAHMAEIDLVSRGVQAVGYVQKEKLMCTAYGSLGEGVEIKSAIPPGHGNDGVDLYVGAFLESVPGVAFTIFVRNGYAVLLTEQNLPDVQLTSVDVSLGSYSLRTNSFRSVRGTVREAWLSRMEFGKPTHIVADDQMVLMLPSRVYPLVSVAALPLSAIDTERSRQFGHLMPFALLSGAAMAFSALLLLRRQTNLATQLRRAMRRGELYLVYQPVIDLASNRCVGAEALIRWCQSDGTMVSPNVFIPAAEDAGIIQEVTEHVFRLLAHETPALFARYPALYISINLSAADLRSDETALHLSLLLQYTGAQPRNFLIEATERGLLDTDESRAVIHCIRSIGMQVAVDDFGTGYSSLSYLGKFELDCLKIDKSFVDTIGTESVTSQVALHIIAMAKTLGLKLMAEGVETAVQADILRSQGVDAAQGWIFSKPMKMAQLKLYLEQHGRELL